MSESDQQPSGASDDAEARDPKELMREALERKKAARHRDAPGAFGDGPLHGQAHGAMGGKRQFRRKSGG